MYEDLQYMVDKVLAACLLAFLSIFTFTSLLFCLLFLFFASTCFSEFALPVSLFVSHPDALFLSVASFL